jgi:hypothetical protein
MDDDPSEKVTPDKLAVRVLELMPTPPFPVVLPVGLQREYALLIISVIS